MSKHEPASAVATDELEAEVMYLRGVIHRIGQYPLGGEPKAIIAEAIWKEVNRDAEFVAAAQRGREAAARGESVPFEPEAVAPHRITEEAAEELWESAQHCSLDYKFTRFKDALAAAGIEVEKGDHNG